MSEQNLKKESERSYEDIIPFVWTRFIPCFFLGTACFEESLVSVKLLKLFLGYEGDGEVWILLKYFL